MADAVDELRAVTEPLRKPEPGSLLDDALDWVVRLKSGEATEADLEALRYWREASPAHEEAFREAARAWRMTRAAAAALDEEEAAAARRSRPSPAHGFATRRMFLGGAVAASGAAVAIVHPPFALWPSFEELSADYRTGKGERRRVALTPRASLELNTQTSMAVAPASNMPRIELIAGEAIAAATALDASSPLVVLAGGVRISATDARFDARRIGGEVCVTCLDGELIVERGGDVRRLGKSEQLAYATDGVARARTIDPDQVTAWREGLLVFRDTPLPDAIDEVNRYRPGKIIVAASDLKSRVVDGVFRLDRLDIFVTQVQQLFGARAMTLPGGVVLLG